MARDRQYRVRLTEEEAEHLSAAAEGQGITVASYIRLACSVLETAREGGYRAPDVLLVDRSEWPLIRLEINRIGHNLNQAVTALNRCAKVLREAREYGYWSEDEIRGVGLSMREAADGINALRGELTTLSKAVDRASDMPTVVAAKGRQRHARS